MAKIAQFLVSMGLLPALTRGDVDAIMPLPSAYQTAGSVRGAQYQEMRTPDYSSSFVLAASEKATANPALTQRVLAALLEGDALVKEGQWLRAKCLVKDGDPTAAPYRKWLAREPLKALDTSRVTLAP